MKDRFEQNRCVPVTCITAYATCDLTVLYDAETKLEGVNEKSIDDGWSVVISSLEANVLCPTRKFKPEHSNVVFTPANEYLHFLFVID